jgi:hypothetical protein
MYFSQDNMVHTAEDMNCVHGIPAYCADFVMNGNVGGVNAQSNWSLVDTKFSVAADRVYVQ